MKRKIVAGILAVATVATSAIMGVACKKDNTPDNQAQVGLEQTMSNGGMQLGTGESNGIKFMSVSLLSSEYEDYGVMATAETAYTLEATVTPNDAGNHLLDWTIAWSNPTSTWANGKTVTDYVTLVPTSVGAKTATISCLQPFGTQVIVTAISQDNPSVKATCLVDYAQKVTSAALSFGNLVINLGGSTAVKYEIGKGVTGMGGKVQATVDKSEVYTIAENFQYSVQLSQYAEYVGTANYFSLKDLSVTGRAMQINTEYYGEEIYFDYDHDIVNWFIMQRAGDIYFNTMTTEEIASYFSNITSAGMYQVNFTITGTHNSYSYTSQVYCNGYTNNTPVNALALNTTAYVF